MTDLRRADFNAAVVSLDQPEDYDKTGAFDIALRYADQLEAELFDRAVANEERQVEFDRVLKDNALLIRRTVRRDRPTPRRGHPTPVRYHDGREGLRVFGPGDDLPVVVPASSLRGPAYVTHLGVRDGRLVVVA